MKISVQRIPLYAAMLLLLLAPAGCVSGAIAEQEQGLAQSAFYAQSAKLRKMPPLHERGVSSLVVIYRSQDKAILRSYGLMGVNFRSDEVEAETIVPAGFIDDRLMDELGRAPHIEARLASAEDVKLAEAKLEDAEEGAPQFDAEGLQILARLRRAGVDAVLLAEEPDSLSNFVFVGGGFVQSLLPMPTKGLAYKRGWKPQAVAGVRFALFDTASGKQLENSGFIQASAEPVLIRWQHLFDVYPPGEQQVIRGAIGNRLAHNARFMLRLLKVTPGEDGAFLTYDPAEQERQNRAYPQ